MRRRAGRPLPGGNDGVAPGQHRSPIVVRVLTETNTVPPQQRHDRTCDTGRPVLRLVPDPPDGGELTATAATGDEIVELDSLLRTCLAARSVGDGTDPADWTAADLRDVLLPPGGACLVLRAVDGTMAALGSVLPGEEPILLVHPLFRGHRLGHRLRRMLADRLDG